MTASTDEARPSDFVLEESVRGGLLADWVVISRHPSERDALRARADRIRKLNYRTQAQISGLRVVWRRRA